MSVLQIVFLTDSLFFFWDLEGPLVSVIWPCTWKTTASILIELNLFPLLRDVGVLYLFNTFLTPIWICPHPSKYHNLLHLSFHIYQIPSDKCSLTSSTKMWASLQGSSNPQKTEFPDSVFACIRSLLPLQMPKQRCRLEQARMLQNPSYQPIANASMLAHSHRWASLVGQDPPWNFPPRATSKVFAFLLESLSW